MNIKYVKLILNLNGYFCQFDHQEDERKWCSIFEITEIRMAQIFYIMNKIYIDHPEYTTKPNWTKSDSRVSCSIFVVKE